VVKSALTFTLPDLPRDAGGNYFGFLVIEGPKSGNQTQGARTSTKFATLPAPEVESITSDMPIVGQTVTITGKYFIGIESINISEGDRIIVIPAEFLTITKTTISFVMPAKPTNPNRNPLSIVALAGTTTLDNFYPTGSVLTNCGDENNPTIDQTWGPNAVYQEADGATPPFISDGKFAWVSGPVQMWWGTLIYWKAAGDKLVFPSFDVIPANTSTDDVYLSYECYNTVPFNDGTGNHIRYGFNTALGAGFPDLSGESKAVGFDDYVYMAGPANPVFPGVDGQQLLNTWYQVLIPLSKFNTMAGMTYKDFVNVGAVEFVMQTQFNNGPKGPDVNYYIDNVRIVTKLKSAQ